MLYLRVEDDGKPSWRVYWGVEHDVCVFMMRIRSMSLIGGFWMSNN